MKLINIGFGNLISATRVVSVLLPDSAPVKRIISAAKANSRLIDATEGRKTKSVIITDSEHIILSYLSPDKIEERFNLNESDTE